MIRVLLNGPGLAHRGRYAIFKYQEAINDVGTSNAAALTLGLRPTSSAERKRCPRLG